MALITGKLTTYLSIILNLLNNCMTQLQKLVKVMAKLKKCGLTFDSKIRFMCQFSSLDNNQIVLDALEKLSNKAYRNIDTIMYVDKSLRYKPVISDVIQFNNTIQVKDKLRYAFIYKIVCMECWLIKDVAINCSCDLIPKFCDDCQDKLHDQGS